MSGAERQKRYRQRAAGELAEIRSKLLKLEQELKALRDAFGKRNVTPEKPLFHVPDIPPSPDVSRQRLQQKLIRFVNARYPEGRAKEMIEGLMGLDPMHHSGWWLDTLDARMKASGWDDSGDFARGLGARSLF